MNEISRIAIDTSKYIFTLHAVDAGGRAVLRRNLRRDRLLEFFAKLPPVEVALEACGGSHHWARALACLGHQVRLIPPQYVKPFVRRSKNDRNDAEAISTAAAQPGMPEVPVKSAAQQAAAMLLSVRELLTRQRTQLVNALRGHAAEFGLIAAKGDKGLAELRAAAATAAATAATGTSPRTSPGVPLEASDAVLPPPAAEALTLLGVQIDRIEAELAGIDLKLKVQHKSLPMSRLLAEIPGVGWMTALTLTLRVDATQFRSGRHLAAWLGLVPRQHSTGGKQRLGAISRAGDERIRSLLVLGATAVIRHTRPDRQGGNAWLLSLLERKPRKLAAVALANKMARVSWAMMTSGECYRAAPMTVSAAA
jgi:transposase